MASLSSREIEKLAIRLEPATGIIEDQRTLVRGALQQGMPLHEAVSDRHDGGGAA